MTMWDGRFKKKTDRLMERFNNSLPVDQELFAEDIEGSIAWARALKKAKVLSLRECAAVERGLARLLEDFKQNRARFVASDEDIHMAIERMLAAKIGAAGEKLHTGRSRNDQVATDTRLYVMRRATDIRQLISGLQKALLSRAKSDMTVIAPAYTHLQQAQPVLLSHYWLSFLFALEREKTRFAQVKECTDLMPLGSGAVAGSGFNVDRNFLARKLGFSKISDNSMDAVASRDFVLQALAACASCGTLLSRYAEDLVVWSSREFSFVELDDAWATGSSMMPQKKNPDSLELIRGKAGRFIGNHTGFAATLKGVGLAYYKDLQEDKASLFDSLCQMELVLEVFTNVIATLSVNADAIKKDLDPLLFATDLADYLVSKGVPFRQAHKVVGKLVGCCVASGAKLTGLTVDQLREFSPLFGNDALRVFKWENAIEHRGVYGGTGTGSVRRQIIKAESLIKNS
ncbi:MAG TPA: argininosuccinate lyase [Chitinivibrionales bacterium]|nr:argininosuccinate lyase [Chitinivibrionales bacterium]